MTEVSQNQNPGLQPYDLSSYTGLQATNFFLADSTLQRVVSRYSQSYSKRHKEEMFQHLQGYGELCGGILQELTNASHKEGKYGEIVSYDRSGNRIEEIAYCAEQMQSREISYKYGVVNLDFHQDWPHPFTWLHRYALAYLMNLNGEGGVSCPLAMTEGMIYALQELGTEEQKRKYLPLLAGQDSDSYFMAGQYVTERVGGSNVQTNRTIARRLDNGKWLLQGEKWFCSNPGDLWVTTAKLEGTNTIGLFLVPRKKDDGSLNGYRLLRKKDIIGSRGKVTAEIVYDAVEAEALGRPAHGIANLIKYIIHISRLHVAIGSTANAGRALLEMQQYAKWRQAYGKKIQTFPVYSRQIAHSMTRHTAMVLSVFRYLSLQEKRNPLAQILAPLLKYKASSQATEITHTAMMGLGGNGILGDFSAIPRMHNDTIINETWEGTHLIITGHFLSTLHRKKSQQALWEYLFATLETCKKHTFLQEQIYLVEERLTQCKQKIQEESREWKELNRIYLADQVYEIFAMVELLEQAAFDSDKDSVYTYFSEAYAEILSFGINGLTPNGSVFQSSKKLKAILDYQ